MKRSHSIIASTVTLFSMIALSAPEAGAVASRQKQEPVLSIYQRDGKAHDVSWALLAAIDRYAELTKSKQQREEYPFYGFAFQWPAWSGLDNPNGQDIDPVTVHLFGGIGEDGNGDGMALPWDAADRILVLADWIDHMSGEDEETAIWDLFQDPIAMDRIFKFEQIFTKYGLNPTEHCFPLDKRYNYTVKHTFGAGRSFGGRRSHEGVDIFAGYGTPALACSTGYVELKGWNRFGGWRIGIRDVNNVYYYYGHLSSFAKGLRQGDIVEPGQVIGYVGSSGYGPPGTSGKFPPHLHFGLYRDTGKSEWAYSPSGVIGQWERQKQKIKLPPKQT
jgi:peptidoglycan LD-endopeptidase LytH